VFFALLGIILFLFFEVIIMTDEEYIDIAIDISRKAKFPYGAIVVKDGKIIGRSDDETLIYKSMFPHAELAAIESASKDMNLYGELRGTTLYTSCEPCMMCIGAILYEGIERIVYAATLKDSDINYNPEVLIDTDKLFEYGYNKIEVVKELHRDKAIEVLKNHVDKDKNRVLITGAVLDSSKESIDTYQKLESYIDTSKYVISSPLDTMKFLGNDSEKYERAMNLLKDTKFIIAEMSTVSTGQGMELQEAVNLGILILVIAKTGSKVSGLVKGCKNVVDIVYYDEIDNIESVIKEFIKEE